MKSSGGKIAFTHRALFVAIVAAATCTSVHAASEANDSDATRLAGSDAGADERAPGDNTTVLQSQGDLQEILVTARRRAENLEEVPISITALSQGELDNQQVANASDLQRLAPSLLANTGSTRNNESFTIRGIGQASGGSGAGVVTYFAEVPISPSTSLGSVGANGLYFDLQNIQVLRGPQGTLFGRNTTGGAVLFEPHRPTNDFNGDIEVEMGNYNMSSAKGMINVPLIDEKLSIRVAGEVLRRDGYTKDVGPYFPGRDYDNVQQSSFRVSVLFTPTDYIENYTIATFADLRTNGTGYELTAVNPTGLTATLYGSQAESALLAQQQRGTQETSLNLDEGDKNRNSGVINTTKVNWGSDLTLKNIASYQIFKYLSRVDWDGTAIGVVGRSDPEHWSESIGMATEELQLQGESLSKRLDWTVGAYYDNIRPTEYYPQSVPYFLGTAAAIQNNTVVGTTDQSVAGYAQATYDLSAIVRGLKITGGFRHTREGLSIQEDAYSSENTCFLNPALVFPTCGINASLTDSANTYNLDLDYEVAPRTNVYVAVRSGFKTGGLNPSAPTRYITYGPEHLTSYETGFKSEFEIHQVKGRVSTDVYLSDYTDIQVEQLLTNSNGTVSAITGNEGRARIKGFEFEGALFPTASIELSASYAFTDAHYLVAPADAPAGFTTLPNAPRNTFSASGRYHLPIPGDIGDLSLGGTYSYQSADYRGIVSYYTLYSGYGLLNADLTWNNFLSKPLDAAIFVTNATNKAYQAGGINIYSSFGIQADYYGPPRMVGVRMNYHF